MKRHKVILAPVGGGKSVFTRNLAKGCLHRGKCVVYVDSLLNDYKGETALRNMGIEILFSEHPALRVMTDKEFLDSIEKALSVENDYEKVIIIDHMTCSEDSQLFTQVVHDILLKGLDSSITLVVVTDKLTPVIDEYCEKVRMNNFFAIDGSGYCI